MRVHLHFLRLLVLLLVGTAAWGQSPTGRYLVMLRGEPAAEAVLRVKGGNRRLALNAGRAAVRRNQARTRLQMGRDGIPVLDSLDTIANALVVKANPRQLKTLGAIDGVDGVYPILEYHLELDVANKLENVDSAWSWIGPERAGKGVKIAIIDTGIDTTHPAFQDASLPVPPGFPRGNSPLDLAWATNKVIVVRNYESSFPGYTPTGACPIDPDDKMGHGTAVAMVAAGHLVAAPLATISGVAPAAYLGEYKVFPGCGADATTRTDVILRAVEDAVLDGMNVINLSLGAQPPVRTEMDIFNTVFKRLADLGVVVVQSAGNDGPAYGTLSTNAKSSEYSIAVGAGQNGRAFDVTVKANGREYVATPGSGPAFSAFTAPLLDANNFDGNSLACSPFPANSLAGSTVLIERGTCLFTDKLTNATAAGAVGAIVFTNDQPVAIMSVGSITLPAVMIGRPDGLELRAALTGGNRFNATMGPGVVATDPNQLASFSSKGPGVGAVVKPDLIAVGQDVYMANSQAVDPAGYQEQSGTSFSSPAVAGAAAVLMADRPGLNYQEYRSLLVDTGTVLSESGGNKLPVMQQGGGRLNLEAALLSTLAAAPSSLSFGAGGATFDLERGLGVENIGPLDDLYSVTVEPNHPGPAPVAALTTFRLKPGESLRVPLRFASTGAAEGFYDGYVHIRGTRPGADIHVPYWYGVSGFTPLEIAVVVSPDSASAGIQREAFEFRVNNLATIPILLPTPKVTAVSGGGSVIRVYSLDSVYPGVFTVDVRLAASASNVFRIEAGDAETTVTIPTN